MSQPNWLESFTHQIVFGSTRQHIASVINQHLHRYVYPYGLILFVTKDYLSLEEGKKTAADLPTWGQLIQEANERDLPSLTHVFNMIGNLYTNGETMIGLIIGKLKPRFTISNLERILRYLSIRNWMNNDRFRSHVGMLLKFIYDKEQIGRLDYQEWIKLAIKFLAEYPEFPLLEEWKNFYSNLCLFLVERDKVEFIRKLYDNDEQLTNNFVKFISVCTQNVDMNLLSSIIYDRRCTVKKFTSLLKYYAILPTEKIGMVTNFVADYASDNTNSFFDLQEIFRLFLISNNEEQKLSLFLPLIYLLGNRITNSRFSQFLQFIISIPEYSNQFTEMELPDEFNMRLRSIDITNSSLQRDLLEIDERGVALPPLYNNIAKIVARNVVHRTEFNRITKLSISESSYFLNKVPDYLLSSKTSLNTFDLEILIILIDHIKNVIKELNGKVKIPLKFADLFVNVPKLKRKRDNKLYPHDYLFTVSQFANYIHELIEDAVLEEKIGGFTFQFILENQSLWAKLISLGVLSDVIPEQLVIIEMYLKEYVINYAEMTELLVIVEYIQSHDINIKIEINVNEIPKNIGREYLKELIVDIKNKLASIGFDNQEDVQKLFSELSFLIKKSAIFRHFSNQKIKEFAKENTPFTANDILEIRDNTITFFKDLTNIENVNLSKVAPVHRVLKSIGRNVAEEIALLKEFNFANFNPEVTSQNLSLALRFLSYIQDPQSLPSLLDFAKFCEEVGQMKYEGREILERFINKTRDVSKIALVQVQELYKELEGIIGPVTAEELTYFHSAFNAKELILFLQRPDFNAIASRLSNNYASSTHNYESQAINIARSARYLLSPLFFKNPLPDEKIPTTIKSLIQVVVGKLRAPGAQVTDRLNNISSANQLLPKLQSMFSQRDKDSIVKIITGYMTMGTFKCYLDSSVSGQKFELVYYYENMDEQQVASQEELDDDVNQITVVIDDLGENKNVTMEKLTEFVEIYRCAKRIFEKLLSLERLGHPDYQGKEVFITPLKNGLNLKSYVKQLQSFSTIENEWLSKIQKIYSRFPILRNFTNAQLYQLITKFKTILANNAPNELVQEIQQLKPIKPFLWSCYPLFFTDNRFKDIEEKFANSFYSPNGFYVIQKRNPSRDSSELLERIGEAFQKLYNEILGVDDDEDSDDDDIQEADLISVELIDASNYCNFDIFRALYKFNFGLHLHNSQQLIATSKTTIDELSYFLERVSKFTELNYFIIGVNNLSLQVREELLDWISKVYTEKKQRGRSLYLVFNTNTAIHTFNYIELKRSLSDKETMATEEECFSYHQKEVQRKGLIKFQAERYCWSGDGKSYQIKKKLEQFGTLNNTHVSTVQFYEDFAPSQFIQHYRKIINSEQKWEKIVMHIDVSAYTPLNSLSYFFELLFFWGIIYDSTSGDMESIDPSIDWFFFVELHPAPEGDEGFLTSPVDIEQSLPALCISSQSIKLAMGENMKILMDTTPSLVTVVTYYLLQCNNVFDIDYGLDNLPRTRRKIETIVEAIEQNIKVVEKYSNQQLNDSLDRLLQKAISIANYSDLNYSLPRYRRLFMELLKNRFEWFINWFRVTKTAVSVPDEYGGYADIRALILPIKCFEVLIVEALRLSQPPKIQDKRFCISNDLSSNPPLISIREPNSITVTFLELAEKGVNTLGISNYQSFQSLLNRPEYLRSNIAPSLGLIDTSKMGSIIAQQNYVLTPDFAIKLIFLNEMKRAGQNISFNGDTGVGKTELLRLYSVILNSDTTYVPDIYFLYRSFLLEKNFVQEKVAPTEFLQVLMNACEDFDVPAVVENDYDDDGDVDDVPLPPRFAEISSIFVDFVRSIIQNNMLIIRTHFLQKVMERDQPNVNDDIKNGNVVVKNKEELRLLFEEFINIRFKDLFYCIRMHKNYSPDELRSDIRQVVSRSAELPPELSVVVFIDEFNTTSYMGMIKSIMCDGMMDGEKLPKNIHFVSAMNPDKEENVNRLQLYHWQQGQISDKEFIVRPIPISMEMLSMDFGELTTSQVQLFLEVIVESKSDKILNGHHRLHVKEFIRKSQLFFMLPEHRMQRVHPSIRDLKRTIDLYVWFLCDSEKILLCPLPESRMEDCTDEAYFHWQALLMSIAMNYYLRLPESPTAFKDTGNIASHMLPTRKKFELMVNEMLKNYNFPLVMNDFCTTIYSIMRYLFDNTNKPPGIACTKALMENLFCTVNCISLNMPLIIWGPPGSSKTLSYQIAEENMTQDTASSKKKKTLLYQRLPKLFQTFRYQCSEHSTDNELAQRYLSAISQQKTLNSISVSNSVLNSSRIVVMLDEAGLTKEKQAALKVIHYHMDHPIVGTVIVSNGPLDAAKMNRALQVNQSLPTTDDLKILTGSCLFSHENSEEDENAHHFGQPTNWAKANDRISMKEYYRLSRNNLNLIESLCRSFEYCTRERNQFTSTLGRDIFHLRDYVYLLRYLREKCCNPTFNLTTPALLRALERNLNGIDRDSFIKMVYAWFNSINQSQIESKRLPLPKKSEFMSSVELIKENLNFQLKEGDNPNIAAYRYLMIVDKTDSESSISLLYSLKIIDEKNTIVCRLSDFDNDVTDEAKALVVRKVRQAMKHGKTILLINSGPIETCFYDVFNRFFITTFGQDGELQYYANIAIGSQSGVYPVHQNFKVILHMPYSRLCSEILAPLPFLNRFEIFTLTVEDALAEFKKGRTSWASLPTSEGEKDIIEILRDGINNFVDEIHIKDSQAHLLRGLVKDETVASMLLRIVELTIESASDLPVIPKTIDVPALIKASDSSQINPLLLDEIQYFKSSNINFTEEKNDNEEEQFGGDTAVVDSRNIFKKSYWKETIQKLLFFILQIASPEQIFFIRRLPRVYIEEYFLNQEHFNPWRYLRFVIPTIQNNPKEETRQNKWCFLARSSEVSDVLSKDDRVKQFLKTYLQTSHINIDINLIILESISSSQSLEEKIKKFCLQLENSTRILICLASMEDQKITSKINATRNYIDQYLPKNQIACIMLHFPPEMSLLQNSRYHYHTIYLNNWNYIYVDSLGITINEEEEENKFAMDVDGRAWLAKAYGLEVERASLSAGFQIFKDIFFEEIKYYLKNHRMKPVRRDQYKNSHQFYMANSVSATTFFLQKIKEYPILFETFLTRACNSWTSHLLNKVVSEHCEKVVRGNLAHGLIPVISNSLKYLVGVQTKQFVQIVCNHSALENVLQILNDYKDPSNKKYLQLIALVINTIKLPPASEIINHKSKENLFGIQFESGLISSLPFFEYIFNLLQIHTTKVYNSNKNNVDSKSDPNLSEEEKLFNALVNRIQNDNTLNNILQHVGSDNELFDKFKSDFVMKILKLKEKKMPKLLTSPWIDILLYFTDNIVIKQEENIIHKFASLFIGKIFHLSTLAYIKNQIRPLTRMKLPPSSQVIISELKEILNSPTLSHIENAERKLTTVTFSLLWNRLLENIINKKDIGIPPNALIGNWLKVFKGIYSYFVSYKNILSMITVNRANYIIMVTLFLLGRSLMISPEQLLNLFNSKESSKLKLVILDGTDDELDKVCELAYQIWSNSNTPVACLVNFFSDICKILIIPEGLSFSQASWKQSNVKTFLKLANRTFPANSEWVKIYYDNVSQESIAWILRRVFVIEETRFRKQIILHMANEIRSTLNIQKAADYFCGVDLMYGLIDEERVRDTLPLELYWYHIRMAEEEKNNNNQDLENSFRYYAQHRNQLKELQNVNDVTQSIITSIECCVYATFVLKMAAKKIGEDDELNLEELLSQWDQIYDPNLSTQSLTEWLACLISKPSEAASPLNGKDFFITSIRSEKMIVEILTNVNLNRKLQLGENYYIQKSKLSFDSYYHLLPFMFDKVTPIGKSYNELVTIFNDANTANGITKFRQFVTANQGNPNMVRMIKMFVILICYHEFYDQAKPCAIIQQLINDPILQTLGYIPKENTVLTFLAQGPRQMTDEEIRMDDSSYLFSANIRANGCKEDRTIAHLLICCLAVSVAFPNRSHFYTRIFHLGSLNGKKCPGSDYNRENYDCGFKVDGIELTNMSNPPIFQGVKKYRCVFNFLTWGSIVLSLLFFPEEASRACETNYHFFNALNDENYRARSKLQLQRSYVYTRCSTFYSLYANDTDVIQQNIQPAHFTSEILYSFLNYMDNGGGPEIKGNFDSIQECQAYENRFFQFFTEIYDNYPAKKEFYQKSAQSNQLLGKILRKQSERTSIVANPFTLYDTFRHLFAKRFNDDRPSGALYKIFAQYLDQLEILQFIPILARFYKLLNAVFKLRLQEKDLLNNFHAICKKIQEEYNDPRVVRLTQLFKEVKTCWAKIKTVKNGLQVGCAQNELIDLNERITPIEVFLTTRREGTQNLLINIINDFVTSQQNILDFVSNGDYYRPEENLNKYSYFYSTPKLNEIDVESLIDSDNLNSLLTQKTTEYRSIQSWFEEISVSNIQLEKGKRTKDQIIINIDSIEREIISFINEKPNINRSFGEFAENFEFKPELILEEKEEEIIASDVLIHGGSLQSRLTEFLKNMDNPTITKILSEKVLAKISYFQTEFSAQEKNFIERKMNLKNISFEKTSEKLSRYLIDIIEWISINYPNSLNKIKFSEDDKNVKLVKESPNLNILYQKIIETKLDLEVFKSVKTIQLKAFANLLLDAVHKREWKFSDIKKKDEFSQDLEDPLANEWNAIKIEYLSTAQTIEQAKYRHNVIAELIKTLDNLDVRNKLASVESRDPSFFIFDRAEKNCQEEYKDDILRIISPFRYKLRYANYIKFMINLHQLYGELLVRLKISEQSSSNDNNEKSQQPISLYVEKVPNFSLWNGNLTESIAVGDEYVVPPIEINDSILFPVDDLVMNSSFYSPSPFDFDYRENRNIFYDESSLTSSNYNNNNNDEFKFEEFDINVQRGIKGLQNIGQNICWANSAIQCLTHIPDLYKLVKESKLPPKEATDSFAAIDFITSLQNIFSRLWDSKEDNISLPKDLYYHFGEHMHILPQRAHEQKDAHDIIRYIIDSFQIVFPKLEENEFAQKVSFVTKEQIRCQNSHTTIPNETREYFLSLCLNPNTEEKPVPLEALLQTHFANTEIDHKCESCSSKLSTKSLTVTTPPQILVLQIKRYTNDGIKRLDKISIPEIMHIPQLENFQYNLISFCDHKGSLQNGHYFATAKLDNNIWYVFDDNQVYKVNSISTCLESSSNSYLLFYQRENIVEVCLSDESDDEDEEEEEEDELDENDFGISKPENKDGISISENITIKQDNLNASPVTPSTPTLDPSVINVPPSPIQMHSSISISVAQSPSQENLISSFTSLTPTTPTPLTPSSPTPLTPSSSTPSSPSLTNSQAHSLSDSPFTPSLTSSFQSLSLSQSFSSLPLNSSFFSEKPLQENNNEMIVNERGEHWSVEETVKWISSLEKLPRKDVVARVFLEEKIDGEVLSSISKSDLRKFGFAIGQGTFIFTSISSLPKIQKKISLPDLNYSSVEQMANFCSQFDIEIAKILLVEQINAALFLSLTADDKKALKIPFGIYRKIQLHFPPSNANQNANPLANLCPVEDNWTVDQVTTYLTSVSLPLAVLFAKEEINGKVFRSLTSADRQILKIPFAIWKTHFMEEAIPIDYSPLSSVKSNWTSDQVSDWLISLGLKSIASLLKKENIDGEILLFLDNSDREFLQIPFGVWKEHLFTASPQRREGISKVNADWEFDSIRDWLKSIGLPELDTIFEEEMLTVGEAVLGLTLEDANMSNIPFSSWKRISLYRQ